MSECNEVKHTFISTPNTVLIFPTPIPKCIVWIRLSQASNLVEKTRSSIVYYTQTWAIS